MKNKQTHVNITWFALAVLAMLFIPGCPDDKKESGNIAVTSVTLNESQLFLDMIEKTTFQLEAEVKPDNATNRNVTWSSGNNNIAAVSNTGLVTAVAAGGPVIITARAGARTAVCTVTVSESNTPVEKITLPETFELKVDGVKTLTVTISPADATNQKVKWELTGTGVIIDDYVVLNAGFSTAHTITVRGAAASADTKIKVIAEEGGGSIFAECTVTVSVPEPTPYKLVIRNLKTAELDAATTKDGVIAEWVGSIWTPAAGAGPLAIINNEAGAHVGNSGHPVQSTIAFVYPPIAGSFTWEVKATVTGTAANSGIMVSRFLNAADYVVPGSGTVIPSIAGIAHFTGNTYRGVFPRDGLTVMDSSGAADLNVGTELVYKVIWDAVNKSTDVEIWNAAATTRHFTRRIVNSGTNLTDANPIQNSVAPFHPAFWVANNTVNVTEMKIIVTSDITDVSSIQITNKPAGEIGINNSEKLTAAFTPDTATYKGVTWTSSNPQLVSVGEYSGIITGVAPGTAVITATSAFDNRTDSCQVTVAKIAVQSVTINPPDGVSSPYNMVVGGNTTLQLSAAVLPVNASEPAVTWSSSSEHASVTAAGLVTAVSPGTANIIAAADGVPSAAFVITVEAPAEFAESIRINEKDGDNKLPLYMDQSITLTFSIEPYNLTGDKKEAEWSSSDITIAAVDAVTGVVVPTKNVFGDVTITVTSKADKSGGGKATDTVVLTILNESSSDLKLIVRNMAADPPEGTTPNTIGGFSFLSLKETTPGSEWTWTGSREVQNFSNFEFGSGGIQNATLLYLSESIKGNFAFSGKITLNGTSNRGCGPVLGVFINPPETLPASASAATPLYFAGTGFYSNQNARWLFTNRAVTGNNTRADNSTLPATNTLTRGTEYEYKIIWDGVKYTLSIDTYSWDLTHDFAPPSPGEPNAILFDTSAETFRHPGFFFQGPAAAEATITITELKLTLIE